MTDALGPPPHTVASILDRVRSLQEDHAAGKDTGPTRIQSVLNLAISALEGRPWIAEECPSIELEQVSLAPANRATALDLAVQLEVARIRCGFGPGDYDTMEAVTLDAEALLAWLEAGDE